MLTTSHNVKYRRGMITLTELFITIGRSKISAAVGVGGSALSNAEKEGCAPSSWYKIVQTLADEVGIDVPDSLFNFKSPAPVKTCPDDNAEAAQ